MELRLKDILEEKGLTIPQFSEMCNVSKNTMYSQLRGNPTLETMQKWAKLLNVDFTELFEIKTKSYCPHCGKEIKIQIQK